jgi:hypothetical protein
LSVVSRKTAADPFAAPLDDGAVNFEGDDHAQSELARDDNLIGRQKY